MTSKNFTYLAIFLFAVCFFYSNRTDAQQLAFPTAEGAGRFTTGGRGTSTVATTVLEVTNLNDDNLPGSLRYALNLSTSAAPHRTIIFRVSGTIRLTSPLSINRPNTTIAGQTAPGDGICIAEYPVSLSADNVIVRYIRFRLGDRYQQARLGNDDAFSGTGKKNIIIDHCTTSWSNDECFTIYSGDSTTLQWNLISEPLDRSYHDEGTGIQNHAFGGIWGGRRASFHHNLIAHVRGRSPRFDGSRNLSPNTPGQENADYRNNVVYNWLDYNVNGGEGGNYNVVNNYYKYGPSTPNTSTSGINRRRMVISPSQQTSAPVLPYGKFYLTGNYVDSLPGIPSFVTYNNWRSAAMNGGSPADTNQSKVETPFEIAPLNTQAAEDAYLAVLNGAGAILPERDTLDERIVNDVRNRTGRVIDVQGGYPQGTPFSTSQTAWPVLNSLPAPADTDRDGMTDAYENGNGLNPNDPSDRNNYASNGYTQLENYLNSITSSALPLNLLLFKAIITGKEVNASWTTMNEVNTKSFEIEKSNDGRNFISVGSVAAKNTLHTNSYSFTDKNPYKATSYYRLKMTDKDGLFTYSGVVKISLKEKTLLVLNPNPVINKVTISHPVASAPATLRILKSDGKAVLTVVIAAASQQTVMNTVGLGRGTYIMVYESQTEKITSQFLKQ